MADASHRAPGWPLSRADLDDVEMLEMTRDDDGQLMWKSQSPPASPESFRGWLPKRRRESSEPQLDSLASGNDAAEVPRQPSPEFADGLPVDPAPLDTFLPTRLDMSGAPAVSLAELLPDLYAAASSPATPPVADLPAATLPPTVATPAPERAADTASPPHLDDPRPTAPQPPMRMTLAEPAAAAPTPVDLEIAEANATPPARVPQGVLDTLERLALVAVGILIGTVLTIVWGTPADTQPASTSVATVAAARQSPNDVVREAGSDVSRASVAPPPRAVEVEPAPRAAGTSSVQASGALDASPAGGPARRGDRASNVRPPGPSGPAAAAAAAPRDRSSQTLRQGAVALAERPARRAEGGAASLRRERANLVTASSGHRADRRRHASVSAARVASAPPAVLDVVQRYAAAYSRMDARATQAVWPAADRRMLASTFNALREQRLTLSGCRGQLVDVGATVACRGTLRYRPRLGDHSTRTRQGTWRFALAPDGDTWRIDLVTEP